MGSWVDEAAKVLDPNQAASDKTEMMIRSQPIFGAGAAYASDIKDAHDPEATAPDASPIPGIYSIGRQFDNKPGGGAADELAKEAPDVNIDVNPFEDVSIPWYRIGLFLIILFSARAFASESAEELIA